jgi:nucleotide-binding universal stress UspA family protein
VTVRDRPSTGRSRAYGRLIEPIGLAAGRGPVVLVARGDETASAPQTLTAAAAFAGRVAHHTRVDLRLGRTLAASARIARELDATLVVVSAMESRWDPHFWSARTASWLVARTGSPVASVSPAFAALPRTCVAAVDFSAASLRAVQCALLMLDTCGTLILTHVRPARHLTRPQHAVRGAVGGYRVADLFERLRAELRDEAPPGAVISAQTESGGIVDQILSVAREVEADLIAVGMHPTRVTNRLFDLGSAAALLRRATCTVLASPAPRPVAAVRRDRWSRYWTTSPDLSEPPVPFDTTFEGAKEARRWWPAEP